MDEKHRPESGWEPGSIAIRRLPGPAYKSEAQVVPLKSVAKVTKEFPKEWLDGPNDVKKE